MGDISTGIGYLCGTCCGLRDVEVSADGSHFWTRAKPDPRERQIDEEFMARDYRQDSNGRFIRQPTPTSSIMMSPRQQSDASNQSQKKIASMKPIKLDGIGDPGQADPNLNSTTEPNIHSLNLLADDVSRNKKPRNSVELAGLPTPK